MNEDVRAARGCPSYVWRDGQERRFQMVLRWTDAAGGRVLDAGCGVGMYMAAFLRVTSDVFGIEVERDRGLEAASRASRVSQAVGERLPFADGSFDLVFSHEVVEHVDDDLAFASEMVRVTRPGGHLAVFAPNRLYPFETHGVYWRGQYRFGNVPLVNYLPRALRNRLVPHVRAYTARRLRSLFNHLPVRVVRHTQIFPGYDRLALRNPALAGFLRAVTYALERTPVRVFGLSHFLVLERLRETSGA